MLRTLTSLRAPRCAPAASACTRVFSRSCSSTSASAVPRRRRRRPPDRSRRRSRRARRRAAAARRRRVAAASARATRVPCRPLRPAQARNSGRRRRPAASRAHWAARSARSSSTASCCSRCPHCMRSSASSSAGCSASPSRRTSTCSSRTHSLNSPGPHRPSLDITSAPTSTFNPLALKCSSTLLLRPAFQIRPDVLTQDFCIKLIRHSSRSIRILSFRVCSSANAHCHSFSNSLYSSET